MVKEPRPGRVKTRLGRTLGMTKAAWWFRHQSQSLIRTLSSDPRWQCVLAVTPDIEGRSSRIWPRNNSRVVQGSGDLGVRMRRILETAPPGPCLIVGSDIPNISRALIWQSFDRLRTKDAVIGPATDGGYWLIGLHRGSAPIPSKLFQNVRWSGPDAMADTIASLGKSRIGYAETLADIDTQADLLSFNRSRLAARISGPQSY